MSIFFDAYNDLSIPYHLTTREFAQMVKERMNPNGVVMTNIIDNFQSGSFLPSYPKTLREVFGEKNVHLIATSPAFENIRISTFVVLATNGNSRKFTSEDGAPQPPARRPAGPVMSKAENQT